MDVRRAREPLVLSGVGRRPAQEPRPTVPASTRAPGQVLQWVLLNKAPEAAANEPVNRTFASCGRCRKYRGSRGFGHTCSPPGLDI